MKDRKIVKDTRTTFVYIREVIGERIYAAQPFTFSSFFIDQEVAFLVSLR